MNLDKRRKILTQLASAVKLNSANSFTVVFYANRAPRWAPNLLRLGRCFAPRWASNVLFVESHLCPTLGATVKLLFSTLTDRATGIRRLHHSRPGHRLCPARSPLGRTDARRALHARHHPEPAPVHRAGDSLVPERGRRPPDGVAARGLRVRLPAAEPEDVQGRGVGGRVLRQSEGRDSGVGREELDGVLSARSRIHGRFKVGTCIEKVIFAEL